MTDANEIDYGPLRNLIGVWSGDQGLDVAPDPDGDENNPYFETITYSDIGDLRNAETQTLCAIFYRQIVQRKSNNEVFHDQTGYWMWDGATSTVMHAFVIPRAVSVVAGGVYAGETDGAGRVILNLAAKLGDPKWGILESPFMKKNASSLEFRQQITVGNGKMDYAQTTMVDIYGKVFEHTDANVLTRA